MTMKNSNVVRCVVLLLFEKNFQSCAYKRKEEEAKEEKKYLMQHITDVEQWMAYC